MHRLLKQPANFVLPIILLLSSPAPAQEQTNADAMLRGWEAWKSLTELAREQAAPRLIELIGKTGSGASLAATSTDNLTRYRALCGRNAGAFRETALCKGLQFNFGERSPWSQVFLALWRRAGTQTPTAREAAAILAGLRKALELDKQRLPAQPQHLIAGLYAEFGRCAPPACAPGLQDETPLRSWLTAAVKYTSINGRDDETRAARMLHATGWR